MKSKDVMAKLPKRLSAFALIGALQLSARLFAQAEGPGVSPTASPLGAVPSVSTRAAADLGAKARPGAGDPAQVKVLLDLLLEKKDAHGLYLEVEKLVLAGEPAFPTLLDFLAALDSDVQKATALVGKYQMTFALSQIPMLHEVESAKLAHYVFAATRGAQGGFPRALINDFLTVFLRFHRGRFPELEKDLEKELLARLETAKNQELSSTFMAITTLGLKPKAELLAPILRSAKDQAEALPVIEHLEARNDADSVRLLISTLHREKHYKDWKGTALLASLIKMTAPEARKAVAQCLASGDRALKEAATIAYFGAPRTAASAPLAVELLNSAAEEREKKILLHRLRQYGKEVLAALKSQPERIFDPVIREMVLNDGLPPRPAAKKAKGE